MSDDSTRRYATNREIHAVWARTLWMAAGVAFLAGILIGHFLW